MGQTRYDLEVRTEEVHLVKLLGAQWDEQNNRWYILSDDIEYTFKFSKWLPDVYNVKADYFHIIKTDCMCWSCKKVTDVFSILVPKNAEFLAYDEDSDINDTEDEEDEEFSIHNWGLNIGDYPTPLSYISNMPDNVVEAILNASDRIKINKKNNSLTNQCRHCKTEIEDFLLYDEFDTAFSPVHPDQMKEMQKLKIALRFLAHASGYGKYSSTWHDYHGLIQEVDSFKPFKIPPFESDTLC